MKKRKVTGLKNNFLIVDETQGEAWAGIPMVDDIHDTPPAGKTAENWAAIKEWFLRAVRKSREGWEVREGPTISQEWFNAHYIGVDHATGTDVLAVTIARQEKPDGKVIIEWSKAGPLTGNDILYLRGLLTRDEYERLIKELK
jgi:hypothetical protein